MAWDAAYHEGWGELLSTPDPTTYLSPAEPVSQVCTWPHHLPEDEPVSQVCVRYLCSGRGKKILTTKTFDRFHSVQAEHVTQWLWPTSQGVHSLPSFRGPLVVQNQRRRWGNSLQMKPDESGKTLLSNSSSEKSVLQNASMDLFIKSVLIKVTVFWVWLSP